MNSHFACRTSVVAAIFFASILTAADATNLNGTITVEAGTASFYVGTNVPAVTVKGKSTSLQAKAVVRHAPEGLQVENIEAVLPVKTLSTGMGLRDEHMRKYIFDTNDGKTPDVRFEASKAQCPAAGGGRESNCQVTGTLSIKGVARPFSVTLKLRDDAKGYRIAGEGLVKLSDYGIQQPSQFGVKTDNEVQVHLEFTGRVTGDYRASKEGH